MQDTAKYLIHADIAADGVVERSDVVGAVFGQTEGLLGDELDLRSLQDASKVGRIDVEIRSEGGQSFGTITIASGLDRVETAILAAALETIDRVGPCRSRIEVRDIEDVRSAKRREVVERAKRLLDDAFADGLLTSQELIAEVREAIRVEDIADYEGYPAGPHVAEGDAIIVVEGRADVLQLLKYGVKNAVAVEGTNVPDAIADLTRHRTVTAFFDGDRGGDLILKELAQVGDVDYVAAAPDGQSVEDLSRSEVMSALRQKVPYDRVADASSVRDALTPPDPDDGSRPPPNQSATAGTTGGDRADEADREADDADHEADDGVAAPPSEPPSAAVVTDAGAAPDSQTGRDPTAESAADRSETERSEPGRPAGAAEAASSERPAADAATDGSATAEASRTDEEVIDEAAIDEETTEEESSPVPETVRGHVAAVIGESSGRVRLLDSDLGVIDEGPADDAFDRVKDADEVPATVVLDGELEQRVLDVAAQRGVDQIVAASTGEFVKRPASVRVRTADQLLAP